MNDIDWTQFTRRISIDSSKQLIFDSWVTQGQIEKWFLKEALFYRNGMAIRKDEIIQKGDSYKWSWYGSDFIGEGKIIEVEPSKKVVFTFLDCVVKVALNTEQGENVLELTQSEIPTDEESKLNYYVECTRGWTFYMANLKSILEGGIDLRNKKAKVDKVINT